MTQPTPSTFWTHPPQVLDGGISSRATACLQALPSPEQEGRVSEKRAREFTAGRYCAAQALADAQASDLTVGIGPSREPLWPTGFVGSITHSASFAWAAVAPVQCLRSIGIDSEPIFDRKAMRDAMPFALDAGEQMLVRGAREPELSTLAFSAKESLFKCLNPCVGVFFDFADAALEWIREECASRGTFSLRLRRTIAPTFTLGTRLTGRYAFAHGHVHTAVLLRV